MVKRCFELSEEEYQLLKKVIEAAEVKGELTTETPPKTEEKPEQALCI